MRRVEVHERRARLGRRHLLATPAQRGADVVDSLVALHATDPPTAYLSCFARMSEPSAAAVDAALYEDRAVVRMLGMRRTEFVVGTELVPVVDAACTDKIAAAERRKLVKRLEQAGVAADGDRWLLRVEPARARAALARRWMRAFVPGTAGDLKWWTGWTVSQVRKAVAAVGAVEVDLDGGTGLLLADDLDPVTPAVPWVALPRRSIRRRWPGPTVPGTSGPIARPFRPVRQRRPHRLGRRAHRRRVGPAAGPHGTPKEATRPNCRARSAGSTRRG